MKKVFLVYVLILFFSSMITNAQENRTGFNGLSGKITGYLFDEQAQVPIEYGNVAVFSFKDSSLITGGISNKTGYFEIDNIKPGKYYCQASFMGYETYSVKEIMLTPKKIEVDLGKINLKSKSINLKEVEIKAEKQMYTYNIEKKVINVDKMLTAVGGSALDILQNIPSVNVDADGTVSLRGNTNLTILIDGKPNGMVAISPEDALAQLPSSSIESIELVTNPSAKYDPEGTGGIINIILKKNAETGFNGMISLNAGTRDKYNGSLNLNYRVNGFNFFGTYNGRSAWGTDINSSQRISGADDAKSYLDQNQISSSLRKGSSINTGVDIYLNNFNTLTLSYQYRSHGGSSSGDLFSNQYLDDLVSYSNSIRNSISNRDMRSLSYNLGYKKTFDEKYRELTFDFSYSDNKMDNISLINQSSSSWSGFVNKITKTVSKNQNKEWEAAGNYVHPINEDSKLEVGFDSQLENPIMRFDYFNNSGYEVWNEDLLKKNYFDYKLQTHAVYATYINKFFDISYQVGLRAERAFTDARSEITGVGYKNDYFSLYPSLHLSYELSKEQELQLSYSRRVDRPSHRTINPYVDYTDSLNISYGNPYLKPQYLNSVELSYGLYVGKTSFTSSIFAKQTDDVISSVSVLGNDGITRTTYENIAKSLSYGMEFIWMQPLGSWWKMNANLSVYKYTFENNGTDISTYDNLSWTGKLNNNFTMWWDLQLQFIINYSSPSVAVRSGWGGSSVSSQSKTDAIYFADIAVKKDFMEGNLSFLFRVSDLFNTRNYSSTITGANFLTNSTRAMDSRNLYLGVSYRLNMGKVKEREKQNMNESEEF
ncbi:MAG: TonB-dependent receptor [bacterium]